MIGFAAQKTRITDRKRTFCIAKGKRRQTNRKPTYLTSLHFPQYNLTIKLNLQ